MTISTVLKKDCAHEPETRDGHRGGDAHPDKLVWKQTSAWVWVSECGNFRVERFIIGEHAGICDDAFTWPDRYRVLKHTQEWFGEIAPNEGSLAAAQRVCEQMA